MFDIAIIGAGPAGTTCARLLARQYKVLLIDKRNFSSDNKTFTGKLCGGLLESDAQKMLAAMGLGLPLKVITEPQLFSVRSIDLQTKRERFYQRHYINIDRQAFDQWLFSLVPQTVTFLENCYLKNFEKEDGGLILTLIHKKKTVKQKAKIIIGADGATSIVRKLLLNNINIPKRYFALQEWCKTDKITPYFSAIFDRKITDFCAWVIPKKDELIVGSTLLPYGNPLKKFNELKQRLSYFGYKFGQSIKRRGAFLLRPVRTKQIYHGKDNIALVGEAAGWISPSSADGLSYAFRSAFQLARACETDIDNFLAKYRRNTTKLKQDILFKNIKSLFLYTPWIRNVILYSGYRSMNHYF